MTSRKIYGLVGFPVRHSFSPAMHNAAFARLKINAEYKLFEKKPEELGGFLKSLSQDNIFGLNVTVPYKEKVMPFLDKLSREARLIGAVNTIKAAGKRLEGFNTDGEGFLRHLVEDIGFKPENKNIAILGAGGACKAICVYLAKTKPKAIAIYDIDEAKAGVLVDYLKEGFRDDIEFKAARSLEELHIRACDLLVNATPIGLKEADPCLVGAKLIHKDLLVYDLIYNPAETKLLRLAKDDGAKVSNGLGMLLYQGMLSFKIWTGSTAPKAIMREALSRASLTV